MNSVLVSIDLADGMLRLEGPRGRVATIGPADVLAALAAQPPAVPSVRREAATRALLAAASAALGGALHAPEWSLEIDWATGAILSGRAG